MREPTEMELRVAKALFDAEAIGLVTDYLEDYLPMARAAIRAMREPTKDMISAVALLAAEYAVQGGEPSYPDVLAAYIDAASQEE